MGYRSASRCSGVERTLLISVNLSIPSRTRPTVLDDCRRNSYGLAPLQSLLTVVGIIEQNCMAALIGNAPAMVVEF